uniref:Uncharacterized protein n=1 Tax=Rhizophora mucronata TaxID=61149 RepID=A0A2P2PI67_RHIMU
MYKGHSKGSFHDLSTHFCISYKINDQQNKNITH